MATSLPVADVAGQRHHADVGVADDARADRLAVARDHVDDAGREDLGDVLGHHERRERRLFRGLEDDDVAGGERGADLPDAHHERVVPRRDLAHDAHRLAADHRRVAGHVLAGGLPLEVARGAREVPQVVRRDGNLVPDDPDRLADVRRLDLAELVGVRLERVRKLQEHAGALTGRGLEPLRKGVLRRLDGTVHVGLGPVRDLRDRLTGGGVDDLGRPSIDRVDPLAPHKVLLLRHGNAHRIRPPFFDARASVAPCGFRNKPETMA